MQREVRLPGWRRFVRSRRGPTPQGLRQDVTPTRLTRLSLKTFSPTDTKNTPERGDDSTLRVGQMVARGATFLFLSQVGSAIVGLLGSIILVRLLVSPSVYAPIGLAITVPGLVMLGDVTGVNASLSRFLPMFKRSQDSNAIWSSFWTGFVIKAVTGLALSVVAYFAADPISSLIGKPGVLPFFIIASPLPFVWVTQVNVKSVLLALEAPRGYALLQVVNEIALSVAPILAVLMGLGAVGALVYMVAANYVYLVIAYAYCVVVVLSETRANQRKIQFSKTSRSLVGFGAPLGLSNSFSSFAGQVVNLMIARFVSLDLYGLYSVASSASGLLSYVVDPIRAMLLPAYSRLASIKNAELMKSLCIQTTRYETAIVLPVALFFIVFATPFMTLLYGMPYAGSGLILALIASAFLPVGLANDALTTLLTSNGFTRFIGGVGIISSATQIAFAAIAIPIFGLTGFLIAAIFSFLPGYILVVSIAKSSFGLEPPLSHVKPLYYALIATSLFSIAMVLLPLPPAGSVLLGVCTIPLIFVLFSGLLRAIEPADFDRLQKMMATQSVVPRLMGPLIELSERLVKYMRRE